jgi:hypothetical protein
VGGEPAFCQVLVVPVQDTGAGAVFKNCPHWKAQQNILWAEVLKETGRGKDRFKIRDLLPMRGAAERFWTSWPPRMWRRVLAVAEDDAQSEASEWELRERREREEE